VVGSLLVGPLMHWVREHSLGVVTLAETGFLLSRDPDTVLAPDAAHISRERLDWPPAPGYLQVVPDLVLEVVSPRDSTPTMLRKVGEWLGAGVQVIWVLWPESERLHIYRSAEDITILHRSSTLTCPDLLPGFELPLEQVFGGL
jgi:Uma2 family endonuclease